MSSIRYPSLDAYWPAVRARAFVKAIGKVPTTYAKNMEILAAYAGVSVGQMSWVNPITFAERLCTAAFSTQANLIKVLGKSAYFSMLSWQRLPNNVIPESRPAYLGNAALAALAPSAQDGVAEARAAALSEMRAEETEELIGKADEYLQEAEGARRRAIARAEDAEQAKMSALARAEAAEEQVRQLKKEVAQVHLADMIAREATQRAATFERKFLTLSAAVDSVLRLHDDIYWTKVWNEFDDALSA